MILIFLTGEQGISITPISGSGSRHVASARAAVVPILFGFATLSWMQPAVVAAKATCWRKSALTSTRPGSSFALPSSSSSGSGSPFAPAIVTRTGRDARPDADKKITPPQRPALRALPDHGDVRLIDWIMSLEADWYSTMFRILICIGQMLSALVFMIMLLAWLAPRTPLAQITSRENFNHLGSLLLAFTMMWTYMALGNFSSSGRAICRMRSDGIASKPWRRGRRFDFHFRFPVPCSLFPSLSRKTKRSVIALTSIALVVFIAHVVDVWWIIAPTFHHHPVPIFLDLAASFGIGESGSSLSPHC